MNSHTLFPRVGAAVAALTLALSLGAQSSDSSNSNSARSTDRAMPDTSSTDVSRSNTRTSDSKLSHADKSFLEKAAKAGMKEVTVSQAAMSRLTVPAARDFAQMMVNDHSSANRELMALAQRKGVVVDDSDAQKDMDKFNKKWSEKAAKDDDLDKDYIKEMIDDHEDAVKLFEKAAKSDDPEIAAFAQKTLPTLQHHLQLAKSDKNMVKR